MFKNVQKLKNLFIVFFYRFYYKIDDFLSISMMMKNSR